MSHEPDIEKEIETLLAQKVQSFYRSQLGHSPAQTLCHLFDNKLMIQIECNLTRPELLLAASGHQMLAQQVRNSLDRIIFPKLKTIIESTINAEVMDIMFRTDLESERSSSLFILNQPPTAINQET